MKKFQRKEVELLRKRIEEDGSCIIMLDGLPQVGKTTAVLELTNEIIPEQQIHYFNNDDYGFSNIGSEISKIIEQGRKGNKITVIIDDIEDLNGWKYIIKSLLVSINYHKLKINVICVGRSGFYKEDPNLAGLFEVITMNPWSYNEMKEVFGFSLNQYIYFGGIPSAAKFINDENRWRDYIRNSIISPIEKPCSGSNNIRDEIWNYSFIYDMPVIYKNKDDKFKDYMASPKIYRDPGIFCATKGYSFNESMNSQEIYLKLIRMAIGAHLVNTASSNINIKCFDSFAHSVDFVISSKHNNFGVLILFHGHGIKDGKCIRKNIIDNCFKNINESKAILVGGTDGISIEEFLSRNSEEWLHLDVDELIKSRKIIKFDITHKT